MKFTKYDAGTPCWADLMVQDIEKAKTFYSDVFDWKMRTDPNPDFGGYTTAEIGEDVVCGLMSAQMPNQANAWNVYLATDDMDATLAKVAELGGKLVMPKMLVGNHGTMAVTQDPQGAFICFWQAGEMIGSTIANDINTICWDELATKDLAAAKEFYSQLFAYDSAEGSSDEYWQFTVSGKVRGGARALAAEEAKMMPSYWAIYLRCDDLEKCSSKIEAAGGKILTPTMNADKIEFRACMDDQGAVFNICQYEDTDM